MSFLLPNRTHLVHKAVDLDALSAANKPELEDSGVPNVARYRYFRKYDGCSVIIVVDEDQEVHYLSRAGKRVRSLGHLTERLEKLPRGTVLFGEAWSTGATFEQISGAFRRHTDQPGLQVKLFDIVPLDSFMDGYCPTPYSTRSADLWDMCKRMRDNRLTMAGSCFPWYLEDLVEREVDAYDGMIARDKNAPWIAGAGKGGEIIKIKNKVDVDLLVVGIEEGKGKHAGRLGAIHTRYEGTYLRVGTGFSDAQREKLWHDPRLIMGHIVRVVGMKASSKGSLREPRFKGIRDDKTEPDY